MAGREGSAEPGTIAQDSEQAESEEPAGICPPWIQDVDANACDGSNVDYTGPQAAGIPLTEVSAAINEQVESLFSDANLALDRHLLEHILMDTEEYVPIRVIASLSRIKALTRDQAIVVAALRQSPSLRVDEAGRRVRRAAPLAGFDPEAISRKIVVAEHLGERPSPEHVKRRFSCWGRVDLVRICTKDEAAELPAWMACTISGMACADAVFALVQYATEAEAARAVECSKGPDDRRTSLRVRRVVERTKHGDNRGASPQPPKGPRQHGGSGSGTPRAGESDGELCCSSGAGSCGHRQRRDRGSVEGEEVLPFGQRYNPGEQQQQLWPADPSRQSKGHTPAGQHRGVQEAAVKLTPVRTSSAAAAAAAAGGASSSPSRTASPAASALSAFIDNILAAPTAPPQAHRCSETPGLSTAASTASSQLLTTCLSSAGLPATPSAPYALGQLPGFGGAAALGATGSPRAPLHVDANGMPLPSPGPTRLSSAVSGMSIGSAAAAAPSMMPAVASEPEPPPLSPSTAAAAAAAAAAAVAQSPSIGVSAASAAAASAAAMAALAGSPRMSDAMTAGSWRRSSGGGSDGGAARSSPATPRAGVGGGGAAFGTNLAGSFNSVAAACAGLGDRPLTRPAAHRLRAASSGGGASDSECSAAAARLSRAGRGAQGRVSSGGAGCSGTSDGSMEQGRARPQSWHALEPQMQQHPAPGGMIGQQRGGKGRESCSGGGGGVGGAEQPLQRRQSGLGPRRSAGQSGQDGPGAEASTAATSAAGAAAALHAATTALAGFGSGGAGAGHAGPAGGAGWGRRQSSQEEPPSIAPAAAAGDKPGEGNCGAGGGPPRQHGHRRSVPGCWQPSAGPQQQQHPLVEDGARESVGSQAGSKAGQLTPPAAHHHHRGAVKEKEKGKKKDYATWAAATPEFRLLSAASAADPVPAAPGGPAAPGSAGAGPGADKPSEHGREPRMPVQGARGFALGRGRPLRPPVP